MTHSAKRPQNSVNPVSRADPSQTEMDLKRKKRLEKNREIAKNCRKRKKEKKEGKKGKGKKGKETEVAEEETVSFIDCFVKVTDFGGPLFKPYDRRDEERNGR